MKNDKKNGKDKNPPTEVFPVEQRRGLAEAGILPRAKSGFCKNQGKSEQVIVYSILIKINMDLLADNL